MNSVDLNATDWELDHDEMKKSELEDPEDQLKRRDELYCSKFIYVKP